MLDSFSPVIKEEYSEDPEYGEAELNEVVRGVFESRGIKKLYKHQADAIQLIREGKNVVITSPTSSGKSEIYISEIVDSALNGKNSIILYPTKALSRDQLEKFRGFSLYGVRAEIYDGDTPDYKRKKIRENPPNILITNMDMLHYILLHNRSFGNFFKNLKFLVLDELHVYSGLLGSHGANILWRLKRIAGDVQFIATSATVGNAKEFAELIFGKEMHRVSGKSAKKAKTIHYLVNPETVSYTTATVDIVKELNKKCLIFGNSHSVVERLSYIGTSDDIPIKVYRGGLNYEKRKEIETRFKKGEIKFLATTSALELGIDIGEVDSVILAGHPGTVTRVRQRIGRAGRKGQDALAVFVARNNPLDQYYMDNPDEYFNGEPEDCYLNGDNPAIKKIHILSAARDRMLTEEEAEQFPELIEQLIQEDYLKQWGKFYAPAKRAGKLIKTLNIRGIGGTIHIVDAETNRIIGDRSENIALGELYPGSIYFHGGSAYVSEALDPFQKKAFVRKISREVNEYTQPLKEKTAEILEEISQRECFGYPFYFGKVHITDSIYGFRIKDTYTGRNLGENIFPEPYFYQFDTYAVWIDLEDMAERIDNFGDGLHGFEHVSISMVPSLTGADAKEVGGISYPSGRMFIYDGVPEGAGVTDVIFKKFERITEMAYNRLKNCGCGLGCPKCILDPMCGNDNRYLNKESAKMISQELLSVK
ncbi:DEAD/DEAH box helicase [Candidatus Micrarchaeota archaeon]|nr:DEAD/DEAH box helicase [Candidatus Micrarchaeota archaeon]